ncbi:MAG: type 4a pilus biogenesis protein PilO [Patescibacteria group bacterium]
MNFDFFKKIPAKKKLMIASGFLILFVFCFAYFIIFPLMADIKSMSTEIEEKERKIKKKHQQKKLLAENKKKLEQIDSDSEVLNSFFVLDSKNLEFITKLEEVASNSNVEQDLRLITKEQSSKGFYRMIPLEIKTAGSMKSQLDYLVKLESLDEFIDIDYLAINSASSGEGSKADMLIRSDTYWAEKIKIDVD